MWPIIFAAARTYAPYLVFPFAAAIGIIGYSVESTVSDKYTPWRDSVSERREQRRLEESPEETPIEKPKNIFHKNISPSLSK